MPERKLVILNQAANYLTVGFANSFNKRFDQVVLIAGSVHMQGETLDPDVKVHRISRWHERPTWRKAMSYLAAIVQMWLLLISRYRRYEVLFVSVPPMAYLLNLVLPHRFSMVIWDVYPDTFKIKGMLESHIIYRTWSALNRRSFNKAWRVFTISEALADTLAGYIAHERLIVHPIWSIFQDEGRVAAQDNPFVREHGLDGKFVVQYSGNIGATHNVESLLDVAEELKTDGHIVVQIVGRGPRQRIIERQIEERRLSNVQMLPFQTDAMFRYSLSAAHLGVVILHEAVSRGSVPSKAYNLMSFGIPALYIAAADSELAHYARQYKNARCFRADQVTEIAEFIKHLGGDNRLLQAMGRNAETAARDFRRSNADRFVASYFTT